MKVMIREVLGYDDDGNIIVTKYKDTNKELEYTQFTYMIEKFYNDKRKENESK